MPARKINYNSIFSERHYDKTFIFAIFVMFVFIFYGIYQIYSISQEAKATAGNGDTSLLQETVDITQVALGIEFIQLPERVAPNEKFVAEWIINSPEPKFIQHTTVHYGYESRQVTTETTPAMAGYESLTPEFASGEYPIPNIFATAAELPKEGTVYMRAHTIIDGKNYWTEEKTVKAGKF